MRHGFRLALWVAVIFVPFLVLCAALGFAVSRGIVPRGERALLLIPMAGIAATLFLILYGAKRQMRRRFLGREVVSFEQWFETHYPAGEVSVEAAKAITAMVAKGIGGGVQPVQILPMDRLDEDFTFRLWGATIDKCLLMDHPLECVDAELPEWFEHRTGRKLESDPAWTTIDDVIRGISARLGSP